MAVNTLMEQLFKGITLSRSIATIEATMAAALVKIFLKRSAEYRLSKQPETLFVNGLVSESIRSIYSNRAVTYYNRAVIVHLFLKLHLAT